MSFFNRQHELPFFTTGAIIAHNNPKLNHPYQCGFSLTGQHKINHTIIFYTNNPHPGFKKFFSYL